MTPPTPASVKRAEDLVMTYTVRDFEVWTKKKPTLIDWTPLVERIAIALDQAVREEREATIQECAKVAEQGVEVWDRYPDTTTRRISDGVKIAKAIRSLTLQEKA